MTQRINIAKTHIQYFKGINYIQQEELYICDNQLLNSLISSNSKKLKPLLKPLKLDKKSKDDLIELCVKCKNNQALNIINERYTK